MDKIAGLSIDIQLVLVAGYLAYKTATVGSGVVDRTEDLLLKVLAFGLVARLITQFVGWVALVALPLDAIRFLVGIQAKGVTVIVLAVAIAAFWRKYISSLVAKAMNSAHIHHDDHQASAWMSMANANATWNHVTVALDDGSELTSFFGRLPKTLPTKDVLVSDDGVVIYVTSGKLPSGDDAPPDTFSDGVYSLATYIPRARIRRLEVGWLRR